MTTLPLNLVDPDPIELELRCIRAEQPIGDVFLASVSFRDICKITYFDVRRVIQEERDVEKYLGIQRPLNPRRVRELHDYVNFFDASYPTSIIIAIDEQYATFDEDNNILRISNCARGDDKPSIPIHNIARVIDGQHRIAGLFEFKGDRFDIPVTIFIGADIADQAHIFATVNLEQNKVSKSLAYDLFSLAKSRSPQKTCHNIAVALDRDKDSPFFERIKRLGVTTSGRSYEPLSQATFVIALLGLISVDEKADRDLLLRNKKLPPASDFPKKFLPFRDDFIEGNDVKIGRAVFDYFNCVKERWPDAWKTHDRGFILNRTNGFRALIRTYRHVYETVNGEMTEANIRSYFASFDLESENFNTEEFAPGSSGEGRLFRILSKQEDWVSIADQI